MSAGSSVSDMGLDKDKKRIETAIKFLLHPKVSSSSPGNRRSFLRGKGLTDNEIQTAWAKSEIMKRKKDVEYCPTSPPSPHLSSVSTEIVTGQRVSGLPVLRRSMYLLSIIGGLAYAVYYIFQRYLKLFWFGEEKERKEEMMTVSSESEVLTAGKKCDAIILNIQETVDGMQEALNVLQQQLRPHESLATMKQVEDLKAEVSSVKGLLLGRNQFAPPVAQPLLLPPSIPAWQMPASPMKRASVDITSRDPEDEVKVETKEGQVIRETTEIHDNIYTVNHSNEIPEENYGSLQVRECN